MHKDDLLLNEALELIRQAKYLVAFTGAGISVESGIPPFRGEEGIWSKYDPGVLDISRYRSSPDETWPVIKEIFYNFFAEAIPNKAHYFLAFLEQKGILKSVITQNIDNLHQDAGSKKVIEYHGNSQWLLCTSCGDKTKVREELITAEAPRCKKDGGLLKPDFVFFGEPIPEMAAIHSNSEAEKSDVLLLIGTTGEVMPASLVPRMAKNQGSKIIEINPQETVYSTSISDIFLKGKAAQISELMMLALQNEKISEI